MHGCMGVRIIDEVKDFLKTTLEDVCSEDITKKLTEALSELKVNLVLHAQIASGPMNLSQVNFDFLNEIFIDSLDFNVSNPEGKVWEEFQLKWKQIVGFFIPNSLEVEAEENLEKLNDLEQTSEEVE
ncbi:hypothetical protein PVK06_020759 [Gossypium arboreum]|uniref:Uncharacterized protein n=1 Tax=Gossypium arboreum TaxID=29729 RepID=A0ABR0PNE3_GOSAR|nr:hypothetical protein PVK06_020759 [Gossypium arboreum]